MPEPKQTEKPKRRAQDFELAALSKILAIMSELSDDGRVRVLEYLQGRQNQQVKAES